MKNYSIFVMREFKLKDLTDEDYFDICDAQHSSCNDECPVYKLLKEKGELLNNSCPYFRNGKKMKEFVISNLEKV